MNLKTKQHICIEFCIWFEKNHAKETIWSLKKAFEDKRRSNSSIKKWHKEFKDGSQFTVHHNALGRDLR